MRRLLVPDGGPGCQLETALRRVETLTLSGAISEGEIQAATLMLQYLAARRQVTRAREHMHRRAEAR
jgi:hypothetical protein